MPRRSFRAVSVAVVIAALALVGACGASGAPAAAGPVEPVVTTDGGMLRGTDDGTVRTFSGVPYAAPPVGASRWRDPRPAPAWTGVRDARAPGSDCVRKAPEQPSGVTGSEDCLFLNVTAPSTPSAPSAPGRGLPVLLYVHGGNAESSGLEFDGARLAAAGAVVVTFNYRLGVFGFLGHPELSGATNFGLADQRAAMGWVRRNAAAFGGDPGNVTLIGESSGAYDICSQLVSPAARGLFDKVIMHSGPCSLFVPPGGLVPGQPFDPFVARTQAEERGEATAEAAGCRTPGREMDCLRALPTDRLGTVDNLSAFSFPVYDVPSLPANPGVALRGGAAQPVPVLQGTTADETRTFITYAVGGLYGPYRIDDAEYDRLLDTAFGAAQAKRVRATYPASGYPTPALAWAAVTTDAGFTCPALGDDAALARRAPVHAFEFADENAPVPAYLALPQVPGFPLGAAHGVDLPYLQNTSESFTEPQQALSDQMVGYWIRFARTADPGSDPGAPRWPTFGSGESVLSLNTPPPGIAVSGDIPNRHHCDLWATVTIPRP